MSRPRRRRMTPSELELDLEQLRKAKRLMRRALRIVDATIAWRIRQRKIENPGASVPEVAATTGLYAAVAAQAPRPPKPEPPEGGGLDLDGSPWMRKP